VPQWHDDSGFRQCLNMFVWTVGLKPQCEKAFNYEATACNLVISLTAPRPNISKVCVVRCQFSSSSLMSFGALLKWVILCRTRSEIIIIIIIIIIALSQAPKSIFPVQQSTSAAQSIHFYQICQLPVDAWIPELIPKCEKSYCTVGQQGWSYIFTCGSLPYMVIHIVFLTVLWQYKLVSLLLWQTNVKS